MGDWVVKSLAAVTEVEAGVTIGAIGGDVPLFTDDFSVAKMRAAQLSALYERAGGLHCARFDLSKVTRDTNEQPPQYRVRLNLVQKPRTPPSQAKTSWAQTASLFWGSSRTPRGAAKERAPLFAAVQASTPAKLKAPDLKQSMASPLVVCNNGPVAITVQCGQGFSVGLPSGASVELCRPGQARRRPTRRTLFGPRRRLRPGTPEYRAEKDRLDQELDEYMARRPKSGNARASPPGTPGAFVPPGPETTAWAIALSGEADSVEGERSVNDSPNYSSFNPLNLHPAESGSGALDPRIGCTECALPDYTGFSP